MLQLQSAFGVLALLAIAWSLGENRRAVSLRQMAVGLAVTIITALVLLKLPPVAKAFGAVNDAVNTIAAATRAGTSFVFGYLGGGALPYDLKAPGADCILAFQALPIVLVMSVQTTLLFYWRILPPVVRGMAWLLERTLAVDGAVGLSTAANIFLDMDASSTMDAIAKGTAAGLELLLNIIAMLLVLVALVYLVNAILRLLSEIGGARISLQRLLGFLMAPVCWLMGLPWPQAVTAGSLMGTKTVLNELIAYVELSKLGSDALDPRSRLIMLYAMCGFANFASLGIMIGGLGTM